jgi:UDP-glucuronate decarboxylase
MKSSSTILWTGATGFFGRSLLRHLLEHGTNGDEWHLVSRQPAQFSQRWPEFNDLPAATWHAGDISNLQHSRFPPLTHVVHAAADSTSADHLTPLQRFDQIVEGSRRVLELAVQHGAKRFLYISSGAVYGKQPSNLAAISEDFHGIPDPQVPNNSYGVAKRAAEHLCALYANEFDIEIVVARCFAFVGEDLPLNVHFAIGNFIRDALWGDEIIVNGDGTAVRSFLDQRDLIRWLLVLLENGKSGEAYNVGSDEAISIADLAHLVRDLVSPTKPVRVLGKSSQNADRNKYIPDITKAAKDLSLRPGISLEQSILNTVRAIRLSQKHVGIQAAASYQYRE